MNETDGEKSNSRLELPLVSFSSFTEAAIGGCSTECKSAQVVASERHLARGPHHRDKITVTSAMEVYSSQICDLASWVEAFPKLECE